MAMALTEKLKVDIGHLSQMKVFSVDGLGASANVVTPGSLGMEFIEVAVATWKIHTLGAAATSNNRCDVIGSSAGGLNIALSCGVSADGCILQVWGW